MKGLCYDRQQDGQCLQPANALAVDAMKHPRLIMQVCRNQWAALQCGRNELSITEYVPWAGVMRC